jgi:predicted MFS family arabinose efflux permease
MRERWLILAVLTFARTAMGFQFQSVAALSPFLVERLGLNFAGLGTLIGLYLLPGILSALPGGVLAQRFGDKRIVLLGLLAMSAGGAMMAATDDTAVLTVGRIVSGTGAVFLNVLLTKMVSDWFAPGQAATAFGFLVTSWPLGIALGLVVLPPIAGMAGLAAALAAPAAAAMLALLLVLAIYRAPASAAPRPAGFTLDLTRHELGLAMLAGGVWTFFNVGFILLLAFGPAYMTAAGASPAAAGAIVSAIGWAIIPAIPLFAWLAERVGRIDAAMHASFALSAVSIVYVALSGPSLAMFVLVGTLCAPPAGLIMTLPGEAVRPERRALSTGLFFTCYYAGMGAVPALTGYLRDLTGSAATPLWIAAVNIVIAAVALVAFRLVQRAR